MTDTSQLYYQQQLLSLPPCPSLQIRGSLVVAEAAQVKVPNLRLLKSGTHTFYSLRLCAQDIDYEVEVGLVTSPHSFGRFEAGGMKQKVCSRGMKV
jgi:hypothetical protein